MDALINLQYTVVGSLILFPGQVGEALTKLSVAEFPSPAARGIYAAIGALHFSGAPINALTVLNKAGDEYGDAISQACDMAVTDLDYYIEQLKEQNRLLTIQDLAKQLALTDKPASVESLIGKINAAMSERQRLEIVRSGDAARAFCESQSAPPPQYYRWGIPRLDQSLYVEQGDFVIVGGYSSSGKTLLSLQFAKALASCRRVGYFSLETSPKKLVDRMISHMARIPLAAIKEHNLNDEQWTAAAQAASDLSLLKLDFIPASGMTVRDIQAVSLSHRYDAIFVDYLQLLQASGGNRYEIVTSISRDLHAMAQSNGITVIALAQLARPEKRADGKMSPPSMNSFRESGQIEQDADVAMLLYPSDPNDKRSNRILKCAKNKDGECFRLELAFDGPLQTLSPTGQINNQTGGTPIPDWVRECEQAEISGI